MSYQKLVKVNIQVAYPYFFVVLSFERIGLCIPWNA